MKKKMIALVLACTLAVSLTACSSKGDVTNPDTTNPKPDTVQVEKDNKAKNELLKMLPGKVGSEWKYNGFAEYGHSMKIDMINTLADGNLQYIISGEVDDMSGGESDRDFGLNLEYVVTKDGIKESIKKGDMMPHKIKELDILKYPLTKGNSWTQQVTINGESVELKAEIIEEGIHEDSKNKVIKVQYTAEVKGMPNDTYKEVRTFEEGKGLVHFENTFDKDIDFNYSLFTFKQ